MVGCNTALTAIVQEGDTPKYRRLPVVGFVRNPDCLDVRRSKTEYSGYLPVVVNRHGDVYAEDRDLMAILPTPEAMEMNRYMLRDLLVRLGYDEVKDATWAVGQ
jgi:hypothetical protein